MTYFRMDPRLGYRDRDTSPGSRYGRNVFPPPCRPRRDRSGMDSVFDSLPLQAPALLSSHLLELGRAGLLTPRQTLP